MWTGERSLERKHDCDVNRKTTKIHLLRDEDFVEATDLHSTKISVSFRRGPKGDTVQIRSQKLTPYRTAREPLPDNKHGRPANLAQISSRTRRIPTAVVPTILSSDLIRIVGKTGRDDDARRDGWWNRISSSRFDVDKLITLFNLP